MSLFKLLKFASYSDEELMAYVKKGKEKAFEELYDRYSKRMLFFFYQRLYQDKEKAQDFLQELFLKIVEKCDAFDEEKKFSVWMYTIASNLCKNEYRKNAVRPGSHDNLKRMEHCLESIELCSEKKFDLALFSFQLTKTLNAMDDKHSFAFELRHQQHLSIREIGKIMDCPEGTVKSRLFYAIKILSKKLRMFDSEN